MKVTRTIKKVVKPFVDVPSWVGGRWIADHWRLITGTFKSLFTVREAERQEDFDTALNRLNLTEQDIQARSKEFTVLLAIYLILALGVFSYMVYLLIDGAFRGAIIALALTFFLLAQAFRSHFWLFQINSRRLGCTFKDWLNATFGGKK